MAFLIRRLTVVLVYTALSPVFLLILALDLAAFTLSFLGDSLRVLNKNLFVLVESLVYSVLLWGP